MRILLDTCVLVELQRAAGNPSVRRSVEELDPDALFLSVVTIGELTKGAMLLPEGHRKRQVSSWLLDIEQQFGDQILHVNHEVARLWGELSAQAQTDGMQIPTADGLISATALHHGLHVMTRNTRHFAANGALILNPWTETD